MKATNWEFKNRALIFGLIFGLAFFLYSVDHQNATSAVADWLGMKLRIDANLIARIVFVAAALLVVLAASLRTWASSYLRAGVVYAAEVKTTSLVADGPYRHVRNPLYLANVLMSLGLGAMMSRVGFFVAVGAMVVFCYRLILREEADFALDQGEQYKAFRKAVPRLFISLPARIASSGNRAKWKDGFKAESWYWGLAAAILSFATTLSMKVFFVVLAVSIGWFWISSAVRSQD